MTSVEAALRPECLKMLKLNDTPRRILLFLLFPKWNKYIDFESMVWRISHRLSIFLRQELEV